MLASLRERLHDAVVKLERCNGEVAQLRERNAQLESELKRQERDITNVLKDKIALQNEVARLRTRRR